MGRRNVPLVPLAPVVKTRTLRRITRNGAGQTTKAECWGAKTVDGVWDFEREESPGTPWLVYHLPSVADGSYTLPVALCGTLRACRAYAANPAAEADMARLKAPTGEWAAARAMTAGG
jgi:hypothetical protein